MRVIASLLLALSISPAFAATSAGMPGYGAIDAPRDTTPIALAQDFCAARIHGDMAPLQRYFAPKLLQVLDGTPADAAPWQTYPDRPQSCTTELLNGFADTVGVLVRVSYTAGDRHWSDTLNFERTETSWLLNNVFYETGGNLRFRLFDQS